MSGDVKLDMGRGSNLPRLLRDSLYSPERLLGEQAVRLAACNELVTLYLCKTV